MSDPIRHRTEIHADDIFDHEMTAYEAATITSEMIIDTLFFYMRLCETRALFLPNAPEQQNWHRDVAAALHDTLTRMTKAPYNVLPDARLDDASIYSPKTIQH